MGSFLRHTLALCVFLLLGLNCLALELTVDHVKPQNNCTFTYNNTLYFYGQKPQESPALYFFNASSTSLNDEWRLASIQPKDFLYCGITPNGTVFFIPHTHDITTIQTYDIVKSTPATLAVSGALPEMFNRPQMHSVTTNMTFVLYDSSLRDTFVLDQRQQPWIWNKISPSKDTPPSNTLGAMVPLGSNIYYFSTQKTSSNNYDQHIYVFDTKLHQWNGYVGSFHSNNSIVLTSDMMGYIYAFSMTPSLVWSLSMSDFADHPLHVQPLHPNVNLIKDDTRVGMVTINNTHVAVFYTFPNSLSLTFYDPLTNTPTYKSVTTSLTANSEASTYFWDSKVGYQLKIALAVCLPVLFLGVLLCLWYKNRQKEKSKIHNTVIVPEKDKMSVLEEAYQTTPLPQPVEDAESWSRRVLRLLTSIAPDRSVFSKPARTSSKSSRRTQHTHASSSTSGTRVPSPPKINQPLPLSK